MRKDCNGYIMTKFEEDFMNWKGGNCVYTLRWHIIRWGEADGNIKEHGVTKEKAEKWLMEHPAKYWTRWEKQLYAYLNGHDYADWCKSYLLEKQNVIKKQLERNEMKLKAL